MKVRKILLPEEEQAKIEEDKSRWLPEGMETGGYIFGKFHRNGVAEVVHVIDGGPNAKRTGVNFSGDNEYATKVKEELQKKDHEILLLGEYHVHPWHGLPTLSCGDINQLKIVKEERPWYLVILHSKDGFKVWDLDSSLKTVEVPYQPIKTEIKSEKILDRILKITRHEVLINKTVLIAGLGSGGSVVAKYLGCTGIGRIMLVDNEELEVANIIRHEGGTEEIGKKKTEICKKIIENHNPYAAVETYDFDIVKNFDKLNELADQADLIIGSSGSPRINHLLNKISIEKKIPAIYGGVYEKAVGGFVLAVKPFETACFNCIFGITSQSYSVNKEAVQDYGLDEDELHQQQGLWIDISFPALMLAKTALALLEGNNLDYNLVLYDSSFEITKLRVGGRKNCTVCNEEEWVNEILEGEQLKTSPDSLKVKYSKILEGEN